MRIFTVVFFILISQLTPGLTAEQLVQFETDAEQAHYQYLIKRYRCLKCQNQNLSDSAAELAGDLRREIATQVKAGKTTQEIDNYLIQRYGEFVLYKPKFSVKTWLLWLGPFLLLLGAVIGAIKMIKRPHTESSRISEEDLDQARRLLKD